MNEQQQARSLTGKTWKVRITGLIDGAVEELAREMALHPLAAAILLARGYDTAEAIRGFITAPSPEQFPDPLQLRGMEQTVQRLLRAREDREKILVHGDYDVDGITAAVLVTRTLQLNGFESVRCFIPHRIDDGYGLGRSAAELAAKEGSSLLLAVDCGTSDLAAVHRLNAAGVDVLILDHHLPGPQLPEAAALVNPKQPDCTYPFKDLCSVGLAFKLAQALHLRLRRPFNAAAYASMAALGTVADLVPLVDENRLLVRLGLEHLRQPANPGMRELLRISDVEEGLAPTAGQVGFRMAPRINAAGRLASADLAAQLFLTTDPDQARQIARQLDLLNTRRQSQERDLVEQLNRQVQSSPEMLEERILVLDGEAWPRGVIGIAAARLVEAFHRPAVVIASDGSVGHGSCRSVRGFNITAALGATAENVLDRFGGHAMAAGFSLDAARIPQLRRRLFEYCRSELDETLLVPRASADIEVDPADLQRSLLDSLSLLEPYGMGNPRPVFLVRDLQLSGEPVSLKGQHLKLQLRSGDRTIEAIWWRSGHLREQLSGCGRSIDVLGKLELNRWGGRETLRLNISDIRPGRGSRT